MPRSVKVERGSTFTFTRGLSYIASISFMHVNSGKLRDSVNQPLLSRARRKTQSNTKRERPAQCARTRKGKVTCYRVLYFFFLSYLIFFVFNLASTLHAGVWCFNPRSLPSSLQVFFFFFFSTKARPRGTLIAATIIKASGKLRINFSLGSFS